ncbi:MAG TPA: hypothetical protein VGM44_24200, partial [Polyangiaceae bacterium]
MGHFIRPLFLVLAALLVASACSDSSPTAKVLASGCSINSDCNSPLVCAFQRCHNECMTSRDCPDGQRCMASDRPFHVCQLPQEEECSYNSDCPDGQVCGPDRECRDQCASDRDCVSGQVCVAGNCADPTELDGGKLPVVEPEGGTPDDASTSQGQPCVYNSECPDPLICRSGLCAFECLAASDCPRGDNCLEHRCSIADAGPEAGPPCVYTSDCSAPLVCRSGQCVDECRADVDCTAGESCMGGSCLLTPPANAPAEYGLVCTYSADCKCTTPNCTSTLVCRTNHCVFQCLDDGDCAGGFSCVNNLCQGGGVIGGGGSGSTAGGSTGTGGSGVAGSTNGGSAGTANGGSGGTAGSAGTGGSGGTGVIVGECSPGATQCSGNAMQTCTGDGSWGTAVPCTGETQTCTAGTCQACPTGTRNCDASVANGCETNLNLVGSCGTTCTNKLVCPGTEPTCLVGVCGKQIQPVGCAGTVTPGALTTIATATDVSNFNAAGTTCLAGDLTITSGTLTDLTGMEKLQWVGGKVTIQSNVVLASLKGLSGLTTVGQGLTIYNNTKLADISGLSALTTVGSAGGTSSGFMYFVSNPQMLNVNGLTNLVKIYGYLLIDSNDGLTNVDGFPALTEVDGYVQVSNNRSLVDLKGLAALTSVGGLVNITTNGALQSVNGFAALKAVTGDIDVQSNASLLSLGGFGTLQTVGGQILAFNNPKEATLAGFPQVTDIGNLDIHTNALLTGI